MNRQEEATVALKRYLGSREWMKTLCLSYESRERKHGRLSLIPNSVGGWEWAVTDVHALSLPVPSIDREEYALLQSKIRLGLGDVDKTLDRVQNEVFQAWSRVAFRANEPENPFYNPGAL